jgi:hypothetical protein
MPSNANLPKIVFLTVATNDFSMDVTSARLEFVPGAVQTITTLDGVAHQDIASGSWNFVGTAVQDWDSARPGMAYYAQANAGTLAAVVFNPHADSSTGDADSPPVSFNARVVPLSYGGEGGVYATTDFSWPVDGTPVWDHTP